MPETDPYQVLGIGRGASGDEIRRAYRGLARKHHPDANPDDPGSEGRFKKIQQAYEVLSEPARRRKYDRGTRSAGKRGSRGSGKAVRVDNLSYRRTDEQGEVGRELRADDLARFARILGIPLDRILKLVGENATVEGNVSFGGRRPGAAAGGALATARGCASWPRRREAAHPGQASCASETAEDGRGRSEPVDPRPAALPLTGGTSIVKHACEIPGAPSSAGREEEHDGSGDGHPGR